jgi:NTP pyrophosphatase (non-canonical NTP hydrolase)
MKLSLFSIIGGTFYQFSDVPITEETLRQFEEEVGDKVTEKLSSMSPLIPEFIKITPELVVSEEHNGDVMVKDIVLEVKEPGERNTLLQRAVDTWGRFAQVDMIIEEMSELTKALLKERRVPPALVNELENAIANIREEIADVQIMLDQMKLIYGDPKNIESEKLDRLAERLGKEENDA